MLKTITVTSAAIRTYRSATKVVVCQPYRTAKTVVAQRTASGLKRVCPHKGRQRRWYRSATEVVDFGRERRWMPVIAVFHSTWLGVTVSGRVIGEAGRWCY